VQPLFQLWAMAVGVGLVVFVVEVNWKKGMRFFFVIVCLK
jgi:hypothetical protein